MIHHFYGTPPGKLTRLQFISALENIDRVLEYLRPKSQTEINQLEVQSIAEEARLKQESRQRERMWNE